MRRLIQIGVAIVAVALITRTWLVQGLVDPLVVEGGSMAPTLLGLHRQVACHACEYRFACGEESLPADLQAVCPNCGARSDLQKLTPRSGDRLIVDRAAYGSSSPQRWDVVVLHPPDVAATLSVKRVVGLPGETVEIRGGDVYIDGQPARRSLRQLLAMAIPVYDARYRPAASDRERLEPVEAGSAWKVTASACECSSQETRPEIDWLAYLHRQTHLGARLVPPTGPVLDDLAYNQSESRQLVAVPDLVLRCHVKGRGPGRLWLRADDGRKKFEIEIDLETGAAQVWSAGERLLDFSAGSQPLHGAVEIVLALVDAQLYMNVDGRPLVDFCYDPVGLECRPVPRPLAIGAAAASLTVSDLVVLRDVYYLPPDQHGSPVPRRLGVDEYWLLGDNSVLSVDSRRWPAVHGNLFVGKALIRRSPR